MKLKAIIKLIKDNKFIYSEIRADGKYRLLEGLFRYEGKRKTKCCCDFK